MAEVKISWRFNPDPYPFIAGNGKVKRGHYCHACGRPLKDETSRKRGYGPECWKELPVIVVLEIPGGGLTPRAADAASLSSAETPGDSSRRG